MSLTAAALRKMLEAGLTLEQAVDIAEAMEEGAMLQPPSSTKSAAALRQAAYRARLSASGMSSEQWRVLSARVISRDEGVCQYCGTSRGRMTCDHVMPLIQGGSNDEDNLVCACHACNSGKSGRTLEEWKGVAWVAAWRERVMSRDVTVQSQTTRSPSLSPPDPPKPTPTPEKNITTQARGTRLAEGWEPDADGWAYAIEHLGSPQLAHAEADKFRDYWRAVPGAKGRKSDWPATWRNWTRRASENRPRKAHAERPHPDNRQAAREANYAAALRGADLAARQRWEP